MKRRVISFSANESWNIYNFRAGLIKGLQEIGYDIVTIAPDDEHTEDLKRIGCRTEHVDIDSMGMNPISDLKLIWQYTRILKRHDIGLAFNYTVKPIIYGSIGAKMANVPSIAVTTGLGFGFISHSLKAKIIRSLYKFALIFPREVWFLNSEDRAEFHKRRIIKNNSGKLLPGEGIDLNHFKTRPAPQNVKTRFLMIGRALWDKGIKEYFEAAERIHSQTAEVEFLFLGKINAANPSAVPEEYIHSYVDRNIVDYLGESQDVREILSTVDCLVLPSYREGTSRVIMEAAAMGIPVIASDVPGCRELVENEKTGYLCESRSTESLAETLMKFVSLEGHLRSSMGIAGRKKMKREFSLSTVLSIYINRLDGHFQKDQ